jgi:hypothetical protein
MWTVLGCAVPAVALIVALLVDAKALAVAALVCRLQWPPRESPYAIDSCNDAVT